MVNCVEQSSTVNSLATIFVWRRRQAISSLYRYVRWASGQAEWPPARLLDALPRRGQYARYRSVGRTNGSVWPCRSVYYAALSRRGRVTYCDGAPICLSVILSVVCHAPLSRIGLHSGVTRVGDTRCGNWGCHLSFFSSKTWQPAVSPLYFLMKIWRPFLLITLSLSLFIDHLFLPVRPRFPTILCKFAHKHFFLRVSPPGGCHSVSSVLQLKNTRFYFLPYVVIGNC